MKGRSRLDRYQNLHSNTSNDEKNINDEITQKMQTGSTPSFRSGYPRKTSRARLYQTSEYDSLLKEHEDFLKSLDEQFGTVNQSTFYDVDSAERQTYSKTTQPTIESEKKEYNQPIQQQYSQQPYTQSIQQPNVQQTYRQQEPYQSSLQQPYTQPVQQFYTQPIRRVESEPQQYRQQPYVEPIRQEIYQKQEPVTRTVVETTSQYKQPENIYDKPTLEKQSGYLKDEEMTVNKKLFEDRNQTDVFDKVQREKESSKVVKDSLVFGPIHVEENDDIKRFEDNDKFMNIPDGIEEISEEEFLELEPIELVEGISNDDVFDFVDPEFEMYGETIDDTQKFENIDINQLKDITEDIFVVNDTDNYFDDSYQSEHTIKEPSVSQEDIMMDFDLIDEDFDAKELDDNKIIEIIDEEDSKKVINNFLKESRKVGKTEDEIEPYDDSFDYYDENEPYFDQKESDNQTSPYSETNVFKFIDDILVDAKNDAEMIHSQQPKQDYFNVEEDKTVKDITKVLSEWNLDELEFVEEESIMPNFDEDGIEVAKDVAYQATNPVHTPIYYDDPVNVEELTQKLESERVLRQQMLEQTKQIKLQVKEYENELESVNSSMSKTNKILNFVLTLLIMTLFVILFVIGFWFAQERGLI
ncbi:MAG: hypothetical protein GX914_05470 [Erysipelotrichia bacterium]|nr:hypothetical protein [Erysipelotrichia bacterium]